VRHTEPAAAAIAIAVASQAPCRSADIVFPPTNPFGGDSHGDDAHHRGHKFRDGVERPRPDEKIEAASLPLQRPLEAFHVHDHSHAVRLAQEIVVKIGSVAHRHHGGMVVMLHIVMHIVMHVVMHAVHVMHFMVISELHCKIVDETNRCIDRIQNPDPTSEKVLGWYHLGRANC